MPDWQKLVSHQLADLALDDHEKQGVIAELACHLEETYEELLRKGFSERDAIRRTLSQVKNWKELQRKIRAAKEHPVNARTSRLWLPSLVTLALSFIIMVVFGLLGLNPGPFGSRPHNENWSSHLINGITNGPYLVNEYTVWLMALPFVGALGAFLSSRAGGTRRDSVISGVFPALAWLTIVLVVLSFAASLGQPLEKLIAPVSPIGIVTLLALIPAACLMLGVLVYHAAARRRPNSAF